MKIAIICDTHWGARGDHLGFIDYFEKFHDDIFFPTLNNRGITHIIHLGDVVDRRKYCNFYTASRMRHCFLDRLSGFDVTILAGNHDTYHKNTNEINALHEIISDKYSNIRIHVNPTEQIVGSTNILFLPWINASNQEASLSLIESTNADVCMGHLQLKGFEMHVGSFSDDGLDVKLFDKFNQVFSGHFHHKSRRNNIHYLGAPYEITWADYSDPRGFHIWDTETHELEFIQNPYAMFNKIMYNDTRTTLEQLMETDFSIYTKRYVKLIILKKENPYWFERFVDELEKANPYDLQIVEDHFDMGLENDADLMEQAQDTFSILKGYINQLTADVDKPKLEKFLKEVYDEAAMVQV